jgi:acetylornithine deacetylase/succinyl-diaminopimelate desuccinylase-like protein
MIETPKLREKIAGLRGRFEDELAALVEIPTVSMDPERRYQMEHCAQVAGGYLRELGARVDVIDTGGFPLVVGRIERDPSWPTVTIYNHLDVQPADGPEWRSPPFTFTRESSGKNLRWFGRGTTDDKGPALTALYGARLALEEDARVNVQFLWELEEEIGSPNFERGLAAAIAGDAAVGRPPFRTDSVVVSDTIWIAAGRPAIAYGLRGLMGFKVTLRTGAKDVHSGTTGGAARNPVTELAGLVAACVDARTGKVKIPGFYDDVRRLSAAEKRAFGRAGFSSKAFKAAHELTSLRPHASDLAVMESIMARPTFEVHGLVGGYSGPGIKTIVPHHAEAKLSTRLVPDQRPAKMFELVKRFIKKQIPDAEVTREGALEPYLAPMESPYNTAAAEAMRETFGREPGFTREGGSIGAVLTMRRLLDAPVTFMGLSLPEHGYHAVNENYDWGQASGGMEMFRRYFHKVAAMGQPSRSSAEGRRKPGNRPARRRRG